MTKRNLIRVNGFLVVRLPHLNRDQAGRGVYPAQPPVLGTIHYGGIDRMPWFDIDEELYAGVLPANIGQARQLIEEDNNDDFTGIKLCKDLDTAFTLLEYSNRLEAANEVIVIRSEKLTQIKGAIDFDMSKVSWIGYDVVVLGDLSLLREGLFTLPASFPRWEERLNESGLFSSRALFDEYVAAYKAVSVKGAIEQLPDDTAYGIDMVEIGRLGPKI
ncbi:MAG TPA: hypothetical protein DCK93_13015 [Blastocatellia bacterium]|nr:hypothetical protein [Blastocatellia bacterium]HAF23806.1 hypothetical protein [Blastocatellia bacterium]